MESVVALVPSVVVGALLAWFVYAFWRPRNGFRWAVAVGALVVALLQRSPEPSLLFGPLVLELARLRLPRNKATTTAPQPHLARLGTDTAGRPFDLTPDELGFHAFLLGATGAGKTTTVTRLSDMVLSLSKPWPVVIVDCKSGGLSTTASHLALRHAVPGRTVDVHEPRSLGYDVTAGDASAVSNRLIGSFTYSPEAEIYKHVAMATFPVLVRALQAAGERVTLDLIVTYLNKGRMTQLGRKVGEPHQTTIDEAINIAGGATLSEAGLAGLQLHLRALQQGVFGELFRRQPALDWDEALRQPSVTYVALPATASSEDVELMGRVVIQDLKQVCDRRLRALKNGVDLVPALVIFDEFAALREALQIRDLLLQAREARVALILSTQYLPIADDLRQACLGAGLFIVHRVTSDVAKAIAAEIGTRAAFKATHQIDDETGTARKGSLRAVEEFVIHPNQLRDLRVGHAAIRSVPGQRVAIVRIDKERTFPPP